MDFGFDDSLTSPDTQQGERYFNGLLTRLTVVVSNSTACFSGRADYCIPGGVTAYNTDDESFYGQELGSDSTRFYGTCTLGHEMCFVTGNDTDGAPFVYITFRQTAAPLSKFSREAFDDGH
jgi:hypothetical protein